MYVQKSPDNKTKNHRSQGGFINRILLYMWYSDHMYDAVITLWYNDQYFSFFAAHFHNTIEFG